MTRRQIREQIFLLLFSAEFFTREELEAQLALNLCRLRKPEDTSGKMPASEEADPEEPVPEDMAYIESKVRDIFAHLDEIDARINAVVEGWKTTRMAKAELAIIRLAVYEMEYEEDMPVLVAINEAVELAKAYGSDRGPAFVNGVLAKLVKQV